MTTPDISRFLKQPGKQYAGVRLQQGRILGDADFNEGAWLREEDRRRGVLDFVGARGAPDLGFSLGEPLVLGPPPPDFAVPLHPGSTLEQVLFSLGGQMTPVYPVSIQTGSFYLGGMRFELEKPQPFMCQRDFLQMGPDDMPASPAGTDPTKIVYLLNGWEQDIGVVEDVEFREPALGGSETSVRVRRMRRVEAFSAPDAADCHDAFLAAMTEITLPNGAFDPRTGELSSTGRLQLIFDPTVAPENCLDCNPPQNGPYLGADNQTLRIMLTAPDSFVWALDDAAPLYRARISNLGGTSNVKVTLLTPPSDEEHFPLAGRVVEILPFGALLDDSENPSATADPSFNKAAAEVGAFTRVQQSYDPRTQSFLIEPGAPGTAQAAGFVHEWSGDHPDHERLNVVPSDGDPSDRFVYVRFWHVSTSHTFNDVEIPIGGGGFGPVLESTAVQPVFLAPGRRGDFWIATLRPETPHPIIPIDLQTNPNGMPPDGPRHFYAPLAFLQIANGATTVESIADCRPRVRPTGDDECSTVTVGNCFGSAGDFTTVAEAIAALPSDGGVVTIRPGLYRERIVIDRPGVILEGCGENTVLLSPDNGDGVTVNAVIRLLGDCHGSRVRSMRIEASEESAIIAQGGIDIGFSALHVIGRVTEVGSSSSSSSTTTATTDAPLIILQACDDISLQAIQIDAQRRPGLLVDGCEGLRAEAMSLFGAFDTFAAPAGPMMTLHDCVAFKIRDVSIQTFGQLGVSLQGPATQDIELSKLTIFSSFSKVEPIVPPLTAVDIEGSRVRLRESRITMTDIPPDSSTFSPYAAVVALGKEIWIEDNHINALDTPNDHLGPGAWGGIQLRGGSKGIVVRGNRIVGGIGHGITLGSVIWAEVGNFDNQRFNLGAGKTLVTNETNDFGWGAGGDFVTFLDGDAEFQAVDEGLLQDVAILSNRIESMSSNGISALTVLGLPDVFFAEPTDRDLPNVERLRIDGNIISGNMRRQPVLFVTFRQSLIAEADPRNPVGASIQSLPAGGIVLATVGDSAEIRNNTITANGNNSGAETAAINGIFVLNGEGITISGNRIQANGLAAILSATPFRGVRAGIAIMLAGTGAPRSIDQLEQIMLAGGNDLPSDGSSARIVDNVVTHPEGRALHLVAAGPVTISGNFFSSKGFHGSDNPEDQFAIGDVVLVENVGGPWERFDIEQLSHSGGSEPVFFDYTGPQAFARYLLNTVEASPRFFVGVGGQVLFQNNQVVYDWFIQRPPSFNEPVGIFPVALLTLDHLSAVGNHLSLHIDNIPSEFNLPDPDLEETNVRPTPMLAHLFAAAGTLHVAGNRVAGSVIDTLLSIWALGEMAATVTSNQTTLQNFSKTNNVSSGDPNFDSDNQVMFFDDAVSDGFGFFVNNLHLFFHLLFRPSSAGPPPAPPE